MALRLLRKFVLPKSERALNSHIARLPQLMRMRTSRSSQLNYIRNAHARRFSACPWASPALSQASPAASRPSSPSSWAIQAPQMFRDFDFSVFDFGCRPISSMFLISMFVILGVVGCSVFFMSMSLISVYAISVFLISVFVILMFVIFVFRCPVKKACQPL